MMKRFLKTCLVCFCAAGLLVGCGDSAGTKGGLSSNAVSREDSRSKEYTDAVNIVLADTGITVDGAAVSKEETAPVYAANDIVFYLEGQGFTYGEGTEADEHSQEEADRHTVVHITQPGTYAVSGSLSAGQIAVDLGEEAEEDPEAVVTLILNGVDITCEVAPAVIFYNVYECGQADAETATRDVDTSAAGANVVIADGTYNTVNGSYVARIYKSYELNEAGTEVVDNKKLHKYDGAFYSKMSMNVDGEEKETGVLEINAENEGLDSELHLTINGGNIKITSGNDGINTNEDGVSVTTINGGSLAITVDGSTGEGDGIDSNGWLVINGGNVTAYACSFSGDAGIDSDMGIHINGGTVVATGNMLDQISESSQNYAVFSFASGHSGGNTVTLKNDKKKAVGRWNTVNDYSYLILSLPEMTAGTYTLYEGDTQLAGMAGDMGFGGMGGGFGFAGGQMPEGFEGGKLPEGFEGGKMPENFEGGELPEGFEGGELPEGFEEGKMPEMPEMPEGEMPSEGQKPTGDMPAGGFGGNGGRPGIGMGQQGFGGMAELSAEFVISAGGNYFNFVSEAE